MLEDVGDKARHNATIHRHTSKCGFIPRLPAGYLIDIRNGNTVEVIDIDKPLLLVREYPDGYAYWSEECLFRNVSAEPQNG